MDFKRISIEESKAIIDQQGVTLVDIRDKASYLSGHIEHALHIDNSNIDELINHQDHNKPLIVYCYHGNSSQGAADFFSSKGFSETYSMDGGFEMWRNQYATVSE